MGTTLISTNTLHWGNGNGYKTLYHVSPKGYYVDWRAALVPHLLAASETSEARYARAGWGVLKHGSV